MQTPPLAEFNQPSVYVSALLLLGLVAQFSFVRPTAWPEPLPPVMPTLPALSVVRPTAPSVALDQPLFSLSRSALPSLAGPGEVARPAELGDFTLTGVAHSRNAASAILSGPDGRTAVLARNQTLGGWRFVAMRGEVAIFTRAGAVKRLTVTDSRAARLAAPPAAPEQQDAPQ